MTVFYLYKDFIADALKVRDEIAAATNPPVVLEFGRPEHEKLLDMIEAIERSLLGMVTDHDDLTGLVMAEENFTSIHEYTAFKRLLDRYFEKEGFYAKRAENDRRGQNAPTPPIEAYENDR